MGEEVSRKELTEFALKMVAGLRGEAEGVIRRPPAHKDWTKEELKGVADLILEDLREDNPEAIERLQELYQKTGGVPFEEYWYAE